MMRVKTSGRAGYAPYERPAALAAPPPASRLDALRTELAAYFAAHDQLAPAAVIADWDVDELRGLKAGPATDALGIQRADAARLVGKVRGLLVRLRLLREDVTASPSAAPHQAAPSAA